MEKAKPKIFLIEDDASIIDVYTTAMKSADFDVEVITWGSQALDKIKKMQEKKDEKPKLVLLDLLLPDVGGKEILKALKSNSETKSIPVFILSNYATEKFSAEDGVVPDKFILKTGVTPTSLVKTISEFLSK